MRGRRQGAPAALHCTALRRTHNFSPLPSTEYTSAGLFPGAFKLLAAAPLPLPELLLGLEPLQPSTVRTHVSADFAPATTFPRKLTLPCAHHGAVLQSQLHSEKSATKEGCIRQQASQFRRFQRKGAPRTIVALWSGLRK